MASVPTGGSMATPALIGAGGQVASAAIGSYGGKKAAQAQERSNAAALAYTKQKDALTRQDALRHEGLWQTQQNQWRNAANQALANWGFQGTLEPISGYGPEASAPTQARLIPGDITHNRQMMADAGYDPANMGDRFKYLISMRQQQQQQAMPVLGSTEAAVRRPATKNAYADLVPGADGGGRDLTNELGDWSNWRRYNLG